MKLFRWDRACRASMVFAFFLSPAAWYTYKIDSMGKKVAETGQAILTGHDGWVLLLLFLLFSAVLPPFVRLWLTLPCQSEKGGERSCISKPPDVPNPGITGGVER